MDPTSPSQQPSSGPARRTRSSRASLNVPISSSSATITDNEGSLVSTPTKASAVAVRGSPYARPTPSPGQTTSSAADEPKSSATPGILSSLFRGALGSIGWASSPSKKAAAPLAADEAKDDSVAEEPEEEMQETQNSSVPKATEKAAPTPRRSSRAPSATRQLTSSRSLSHLGPQREGSLARDRRSVAPSPARETRNGFAGPPPSAWPGPTGVAAGTRSRSRGLSRDPSPALTNVSAHVAPRRSVGTGSHGLYGSQGQRPLSMMALSSTAMSEFGAGGPSPRRISGGHASSSFHVPSVSPFAAPNIYRAGSVAGSSRGGTPVRRAGSLAPGGGGGYLPSPLGGVGGGGSGRPSSRAGSIADSAVSGFTAGGTPRRGRNSLNLSGAAVRRAPSVLGLAAGGGNGLGGRPRGARLSEGEAILESYMHSREGELDLERMSQTGGSRAGTPAGGRAGSVLGQSQNTHPGLHVGVGGVRGRSVAPSPSPLRAALGMGRQYTPLRNSSPVVGQKRRSDSVTGDASDRLSNMSIMEPSRKKQVVYNAEQGRYMTLEAMQALKPRQSASRNTADMIMNEIEGVRTPLGDAQKMARRAVLTGVHLPANVAVPEPRANLSAAKAVAAQMLPPKLPGSVSSSKSIASKPIGPLARRQAFLDRVQKAKMNAGGSTEDSSSNLRDRVQQIRARDGTNQEQHDQMDAVEDEERQQTGSDEEMSTESQEKEPSPEPEPAPKPTRKSSRKNVETESTSAATEAPGSKRTLRTRKGEADDDEPPSAAATVLKESSSSKSSTATEQSKSEAKKADSQSTATQPTAAPAKANASKPDTFQVLTGDAPRSTSSSLRQRTEKKHRKHETVGRFGIDDDDDEEEDDGVTAEELAKITAPRILFPAGFKFGGGGDAASKPALPAAPAAQAAKTAETLASSTFAPASSIAAPAPAASVSSAPSVSLPALLPPPKDAVPVTSLFDRIGEKTPAADMLKSPKKTVTFAHPISETTTFQKDSFSNKTSISSPSTLAPAPAPAASGFQFKAPSSTDSLFKLPSAGPTATSSFFTQPAAKEADKPSGGDKSESSAGTVPNFFSSTLQKRDADKSETASSPVPATASSSGVPNFFGSSLNKAAAPTSTSTTTSTTLASIPNFFAGSSNKETSSASTSTPAASAAAPVASTNALKGFAGFGAPATASPTAAASAASGASTKPAFTNFGASADSQSASDSASKPATFSFGGSAAAAAPATNGAAPPASSLFGDATSRASQPLFGSSSSTKRPADEAGSGDSSEPTTKKPFGGFQFTAPAASTGTSSTAQSAAAAPVSAAPANLFGKPATSSTGSASGPFAFTKPAATTPTASGTGATLTPGFSFGAAATNTATTSATANNLGNSNGMDTSGSPPKSGFGFGFGSNNAAPTASTAPSTSMFGQPSGGQPNASAPAPSFGFGQPQGGPAASTSNMFGSKPATSTSASNVFGQSTATTNSGVTAANPFGGFNSGTAPTATPTANGFGSGSSGMTLNTKPNFNFGAASGQGPNSAGGGMFAFGSGSNTPTQSTTPTVAPATPPVFGGFGASNASAPSAGSAAPFAFGGGGGGQAAAAQPSGGAGAAFQFGAGAGATTTPTTAPASPFMFNSGTPGAGGAAVPAPGGPAAGGGGGGGPMFSMGAAPMGAGGAAGATGPGGRPMRALPRRKK